MPRRDSWVSKVATVGQMKPTSAASVVYECNAGELLYNTFIGLNRWPREGWDGGRVDFSHFLRGIELQSRLTLLNELEGGVTPTPWLRSPVSRFSPFSRRPSLFSLMGLSDP